MTDLGIFSAPPREKNRNFIAREAVRQVRAQCFRACSNVHSHSVPALPGEALLPVALTFSLFVVPAYAGAAQ